MFRLCACQPGAKEGLTMGDVEPAMDEDWMDRLGQVVIGAVIAGGVVATLGIVADMAQPTMGATRSARLEWERRQAEVRQAVG